MGRKRRLLFIGIAVSILGLGAVFTFDSASTSSHPNKPNTWQASIPVDRAHRGSTHQLE
jgi:hypothetical protein